MKKAYFLGLLLLFFIPETFAQTGQVFHLNKLSKNDTLLCGWKFHPGDDQQWKDPAFGDTKWESADPGQDMLSFRPFRKSGIGWLRLHIKVDSSITARQLTAWISQCTASEVYLNGRLIQRYGLVSADPAKVKAYSPSKEPFFFKLVPGEDNVVAVRLAYQPGIPYISTLYVPLPAFALYVNDYQSAIVNYHAYQQSIRGFIMAFTLSGGMLLIIGIIYLVYFLFDRGRKVNLYYSLFCVAVSLNTMPNELWGVERYGSMSSQMWLAYAEGFFFITGILFMLLTIFALFNYRHRAIFKSLVLVSAAAVIFMYFRGTEGFVATTVILPGLCAAEGAHVCIWAIKRQMQDAGFILAGTVIFILLTVIGNTLDQNTVLAQSIWSMALVCFPIGMSFYLGVQNSLTNKKLRTMLDEVQTLSAQNLAQEQEKQQILADQNIVLEQQVSERTAELNQSLTNLKATQTQLIQSEKMASLGELTAGIAHEIQNPLNFVNNFSEVSAELTQELKEELKNGHTEDAIAIADDLEQNLGKIQHHGKRADAIVKGMLQHSQSGSGVKEPTDINLLADEFIRLAYHGLRAKDKGFNADLLTNFDEKLPKVNLVPQDIGRVMLNLFNNAFYAVNQKTKTAGADYKPEVSVSTSTENNHVVIKVKDNGTGMPDAIKAKIMQPFFTTKPTGEGTGLGLSLTYDMVVKGHGGTIQVNSKEGEGSEFIITIPIS